MMRALVVVCALVLLPMTASAKRHKPKRHKAKVTRVAKREVAAAPARVEPARAAQPAAQTTVASRGPMVQQVWDDEVPGKPKK